MDLLELFIKGVVIGLVIAAPVGPIGFLCISRTLEYGALIGLATGLGAATADAVYGAVAAFGLMQVAAHVSHRATPGRAATASRRTASRLFRLV